MWFPVNKDDILRIDIFWLTSFSDLVTYYNFLILNDEKLLR